LTGTPHSQRQNLVGAAEQRKRDGEPQYLRVLEFDDQIGFRGLLDQQIDWLLTLESPELR
jgi:hypothetical protein